MAGFSKQNFFQRYRNTRRKYSYGRMFIKMVCSSFHVKISLSKLRNGISKVRDKKKLNEKVPVKKPRKENIT